MNPTLARQLIQEGQSLKEVKSQTGITNAVYFQIKRELKPTKVYFGCVVCCGTVHAKGFCQKHYNRYLGNPEAIRKLKAA